MPGERCTHAWLHDVQRTLVLSPARLVKDEEFPPSKPVRYDRVICWPVAFWMASRDCRTQ